MTLKFDLWRAGLVLARQNFKIRINLAGCLQYCAEI